MWEILDTGRSGAEENMRIDAELLQSLGQRDRPILHLYDWEGDCATYGYFTKPGQFLDIGSSQREGVRLARRPTGGGIVFHAWDLAFSVLVPAQCSLFSENTLANYALINNVVLRAVEAFKGGILKPEIIPDDAAPLDAACKRFCMAQPTKYDVVWNGQKIAGAAQRQTKEGFLHQGTISIKKPDYLFLEKILLRGSRVLEAMRANTFTLLSENASESSFHETRLTLKKLLTSCFTKL